MYQFLKEILQELEQLNPTNYIEPDAEIKPNDHRVGEATEELKQIYSLSLLCTRAAIEEAAEAQFGGFNTHAKKEKLVRAVRFRTKAEILREIFWLILRDQFNLWDKDSVGIRKDWVVVWSEPDPTPEDFLRRLFG